MTNGESAKTKQIYGDTMKKTIKDWRPVLYKLAATGFSYPGLPLAESLTSGKFLFGMEKISKGYQLGLGAEIREVEKNLSTENPKELLGVLESEYVRLFLADVGGAKVNPFGSHYLDGRVMGKSVDKVVRKYGRAGMAKREGYQGPPDDIAVELEYLFKVTQMEDKSSPKHLSEHADFYDELLGPWLGEFTEAVKNETDMEFYAVLADWVCKGLEADRELIENLLKEGNIRGV
ncbi:MAG: TorD/DmsD family molecular chaperone [Candidatus Bipolaricaulota bacterium]